MDINVLEVNGKYFNTIGSFRVTIRYNSIL